MSHDPFKLDEQDLASDLWQRIEAHLHKRLDTMRVQNDTALTPDLTATLRGKIAFAKEILALGKLD